MLDIDCGQTVNGIAGDAKASVDSFRFTNDQEQDIVFSVTNNTFFPILKIKNSEGRIVERVDAMDCDEDECDGVTFKIEAVFPGEYTVEIMPNGNGGEFKVDMMCSEGRVCTF